MFCKAGIVLSLPSLGETTCVIEGCVVDTVGCYSILFFFNIVALPWFKKSV